MTAPKTIARGASVAPVFDDLQDNPIVASSLRLRRNQWQQIKAIAQVEDRSMNEVMEFFLRWAIDDWKRETRKIEAYKVALIEIEKADDQAEAAKASAAKTKRAPKRKA